MTNYHRCECEDDKHFQEFSGAHPYGAEHDMLIPVLTIMGSFWVCAECSQTCYGPDSGVRYHGEVTIKEEPKR